MGYIAKATVTRDYNKRVRKRRMNKKKKKRKRTDHQLGLGEIGHQVKEEEENMVRRREAQKRRKYI